MDAGPPLSWAEQEVLDALKRLARAQSQLQALEIQAGPEVRTFDPADVARLEAVAKDLAHARAKASGRFAKGSARDRVHELEMSERLQLERMDLSSVAELRAILDAPAPAVDPVDPAVLSFARQELAAAQQAWLDVQDLEVHDEEAPDRGAEPASDPGGRGGRPPASPGTFDVA